MLKKSNKNSYQKVKFWWLIAFLNIIKKIIKTVTTKFIQNITKKHNLLSSQQMRVRKNRSTKMIINLLLNQIKTVWDLSDYIASILSLNITEAYDRVIKRRLVHILWQRRISLLIVKWVKNYMSNRFIILVFENKEFKKFEVNIEIS